MSKTIVTHIDPDLDALCATWLLKKYAPGFALSKLAFLDKTNSGEISYKGVKPGESEDIVFVDMGYSRFDHHQSKSYVCSATLVYDYLKEKGWASSDPTEIKALAKILDYVLKSDHGKLRVLENEYRDFLPIALIEGKSLQFRGESKKIMDFGFEMFEALYSFLVEKENFRKDWEKRVEFETPWGIGVGLQSAYYIFSRDFGLPKPYTIAVNLHPIVGFRRFWGFKDAVDFSQVYKKLIKLEPGVDWYLHPSKKILTCGAKSAPKGTLSRLSLEKLIEQVKK